MSGGNLSEEPASKVRSGKILKGRPHFIDPLLFDTDHLQDRDGIVGCNFFPRILNSASAILQPDQQLEGFFADTLIQP